MKRHNNLYEKICDIENLRLAHKKASKGKTYYKEVKMVNDNPEYYLWQIQEMLINKTFKTSKYKVFELFDGNKERTIHKLPYYPDRIVQWAIMLVIEPIFISTFTKDTYSAIPNRGIHKALGRLKKALKNKDEVKYCLKLDIKKYYPNIDHQILKNLLRKKFKDNDLLWLLDDIIDSIPGEKGLPIGNYTSQYFANFYLAYFDHWLKEQCGVRYYYRYMDDVVILGRTKQWLRESFNKIKDYLEILKLTIKKNWQIFPSFIRGIDFIGYRCFGNFTLLRKSIADKFKNKMKKIVLKGEIADGDYNSIMSYYGWLKWCDARNLFNKYTKELLNGTA